MQATLDVNRANFANAIVTTDEMIEAISSSFPQPPSTGKLSVLASSGFEVNSWCRRRESFGPTFGKL